MSTHDLRSVATELTDRIRAFESHLLNLGGVVRCCIDIDSTHKLSFERSKTSWGLVVITPTTDHILCDASLDLKILCAPHLQAIIPAMIQAQTILISRINEANSTLSTTFSDLDIDFPPPSPPHAR